MGIHSCKKQDWGIAMTLSKRDRHARSARVLTRSLIASASLGVLLASSPADATHSWGGYHWATTSQPFKVKFGDNVDSNWQAYVEAAVGLNQSNSTSGYWQLPSYTAGGQTVNNPVRTRLVTGSASPRTCKPTSGMVQVCNARYGYNGWLGVAQIWISGLHITQGTVKLNDSYYNLSTYNTPDWRAIVACQEIGHTFGLDHQDEDQTNADLPDANGTQTCMDYTSTPQGNGQPNFHDYEELGIIYNHNDGFTTLAALPVASPSAAASVAGGGDTPAEWGRAVAFTSDGRPRVFEKAVAPGKRIITFVFWGPGKGPGRP
jgi:hypothetical protein